MAIAGREIGPHRPPYIVAEISCNHGGDLRKALTLVHEAKKAGANAVKFQTYTPDELTTPKHEELWELYTKAHTPREWHRGLFDYARAIGITAFSSAFSVDGVRFLAGLGVPAIKIASAEINDRELIQAAYATGLPLIMSMGMANSLSDSKTADIALHCIACYPSRIEDANLRAFIALRNYCGGMAGLSDHTSGYETAIAATALGAVMIEKHLKLSDDCIDAAYSLDPQQFADMCKAVRAIWTGMGDGVIRPTCQPRQR